MAACSTASTGFDAFGLPISRPITRGELLAHQESHLFYPGSRLVRDIGASQTTNQEGEEPNPAYAGAILTASVTADTLYAFYRAELEARGFHMVNDYRLASQVSGQAWETDQRVQVQIGVFDPALLQADQHIRAVVGPGRLVYEEVLVGYSSHPRGDATRPAEEGAAS
ncbi:MAG: hypothetical protein ACRDYE_08275 [Acidimicrobiales bacterium]